MKETKIRIEQILGVGSLAYRSRIIIPGVMTRTEKKVKVPKVNVDRSSYD